MGKYHKEDELDAFGHLTWTVGNEDWIACFDAIRVGNKVKYHVVVDSESGGFVDTMEEGEVAAKDAVAQLGGLPDYWYGIALDHYADEEGRDDPDSPYHLSDEETERVSKSWIEHLKSLEPKKRKKPKKKAASKRKKR